MVLVVVTLEVVGRLGSLGQVLHCFEAFLDPLVGLALEATKRLVVLVFWTLAPPGQTVPLK